MTTQISISEEEIVNQIERTQKMVKIAANEIGRSF